MPLDLDPLSPNYGKPLASSDDALDQQIMQREIQSREQLRRAAALSTADRAPDRTAEVLNLSRQLQRAPGEVEAEIARSREAARAANIDWSSIPERARRLAEADATAPIVRDDLDQLSGLSRAIEMLGFGFRQGRDIVNRSLLREKAARGPLTPAEQAELTRLRQTGREISNRQDFANEWINVAANAAGTMYETFIKAGPTGAAAGTAAAVATAVAGQAGPQVLVPEELATVPTAFTLGFMTKAFEVSARQQRGEALENMDELERRQGRRLDPDVKDLTATLHGIVGGALDTVSLGVATGPIRRVIEEAGKRALVRPTVQQALLRFGQAYVETVGSEVATETLQEASSIMFESIAKEYSAGNWTDDPQQAEDRIANTIVETTKAMLLLGPFVPAGGLAMDMRAVQRANDRVASFREFAQWVEAVKLRERSPEEFRATVNEEGAKAGIEDVYISAPAFRTYFQSQGMDPEVVAQELGVSEQLQEIGDLDRDLVIPLGTFAERVVPTEHYAELVNDVRFSPMDMSAREAKDGKDTIAAYQQQAEEELQQIEERHAVADTEAQQVYDEVVQAQVAAGTAQKTAEKTAALYRAFFRTRALRRGTSVLGEWQAWSFGVERPGLTPEGAPERGFRQPADAADEFSDSQIRDESGALRVMYRGDRVQRTSFEPNALGLLFTSPSEQEARTIGGDVVHRVQVRARNPFDGFNEQHLAAIGATLEDRLWDSAEVESPAWIAKIKAAGFDGLYSMDDPGARYRYENPGATPYNLAVFDAAQVRLEEAGANGDRAGSSARGATEALDGAPQIQGVTGPDPRLVAVAERYARANGIRFGRQARYAKVDRERAARIAQAYEDMAHAPGDPRVQAAYAALIEQTISQYRALEAAGYKFWFYDETNDPYEGNPWNAMRDLRATQSMAVFASEAGFGSGATDLNVEDNPLLADTGITWPWGSLDGPPKRVLANDLFRAVHDAFGHGLEGAGFRAQGEENAWQAHVRLYTGDAIGAATTETRGQNSWLNYGPHGENNRNAKVEDTVFADQKTGLMPEWTWSEGIVEDMPRTYQQSLSTRIPTAQKGAEDHRGEVLVTNLDAATRHIKSFEKNVDVVTSYSNYRPSARAVTPLQRANRFIDHVVSNLLWLHDQTAPEVRDRARLWYDGARKLAERWAEKYNITDMQAAAVLAALSPQKDWYQNVSLAERVLDIMTQGIGPWTPEMQAWLDGAPTLQTDAIKAMRQELIDKDIGNKPEPSLAAIALYVRAYDEVHNTRNYRILTPEGDFVEFATNDDGSRSKVAWGGFGTIAKAVSAFKDGRADNISVVLGTKHKVRNFYNNIYHPTSSLPFVTIDTHAVAAGLLRPLSGNSDEVTQNFGGKGSASAATTGNEGTYSLFAEAYIRAANQRGILPREMQSITWEAVRALFPAEWKNAKNNAAVAAIWDRYRAGRLSLENARAEIVATVGRFGRPEWGVGTDGADAAQAPTSSYREELAGSVVPRGMDGGRGDGGGRGAADPAGGVPPEGLTLQQSRTPELQAYLEGSAIQTVMYTGTSKDVDFHTFKAPGNGIWITGDPKTASMYAMQNDSMGAKYNPDTRRYEDQNTASRVMPLYVRMLNPLRVDDLPEFVRTATNYRAAQKRWFDGVKAQGYDGVIMPGDIAVVFEPTQLKSAIGNQGTFDPRQKSILKQDDGKAPRGEIAFNDKGAVIRLFAAADLSTFLHESGHLFLEIMRRTDDLQEEQAAILSWLGLDSMDQIETVHHERFARAFEAYLHEGRAPSAGLAAAFRAFRDWLVEIYGMVTRKTLDVELSPTIREVFDRMLATDEEIAAQAQAHSIVPVLDALTGLGLTEREANGYREKVAKAASEAREKLLAKALRQVRRERTAQYREREKALREEATARVSEMRVYRAQHYLMTGTMLGSDEPPPVRVQLSRKGVEDMVGKKTAGRFGRFTVAEGGVSPDTIAPLLGYRNGGEMLDEFEGSPTMKQAIDMIVKRGLQAEFGDMLNDGTLEREALESLQTSEAQIELLAEEVRILRRMGVEAGVKDAATEQARKAGPRDAGADDQQIEDTNAGVIDALIAGGVDQARGPAIANMAAGAAADENARGRADVRRAKSASAEATRFTKPELDAMRAAAEDAAGRRKVRAAGSMATWMGEEARAFRALKAALAARRWDEAAMAARQRLFSRLLTSAGVKAKREVTTGIAYLRRMAKVTEAKSIDIEYLDQIHALLERFNLKQVSKRRQAVLKNLNDFIAREKEEGRETAVPDALLDEANRTSYQEMTVEEFRGLVEAVKNIEHLGRLKNKLLDKRRREQFEQVKGRILDTILSRNKLLRESQNISPDMRERFRIGVNRLHAEHTKLEFLFQALDGEQELGPVWDAFFRPFVDAENEELRRGAELQAKLKKIFEKVPAEQRAKWHTERTYVKALGMNFTRAELISLGLNWGNEGNRAALMNGQLQDQTWSEAQINAALAEVTDAEWDVIQEVWDLIDTLWPDIVDLYRDVAGITPGKVEALPFVTPTGKAMRGGYYPLKYDPRRSHRALQIEEKNSSKDLLSNNFVKATTKDGHTKARVENVKLKVRLDLSVASQHLQDVLHDLTHRRALLDVNKLATDPDIRAAITNTQGSEMYQLIRPWLQAIAAGTPPPSSSIEKLWARARAGASVVNMGWKISTAIVQPIGYTQTIDAIGEKWALRGLSRFYASGDIGKQVDFVFERSEMMRNRMKTFDRDVADTLRRLTSEGKLDKVRETFFWLTGMADLGTALPSWLGAYGKGMEQFNGNEEQAIQYADMIVRTTQSSGSVKDLAEIQRGSELQKLFTAFYSYFNVLYNLFAKRGRQLRDTGNVPRFLASMMYLWWVPAVLSEMIAGRAPDDEDDWLKWALKKELAYPLQSVVLLRDIVQAASTDFDYEVSPAAEMFKAISDTVENLAEDDGLTRSEIKKAVAAVGYTFALPTRQVTITSEAFYRWLVEGDDVPLSDFFLSPQRKAKQ